MPIGFVDDVCDRERAPLSGGPKSGLVTSPFVAEHLYESYSTEREKGGKGRPVSDGRPVGDG